MMKSALLSFKILFFSVIHHVACFCSCFFLSDVTSTSAFTSHFYFCSFACCGCFQTAFLILQTHNSFIMRKTRWNEHGQLQELADSLSSDWAHACGFCCHVLVTFDEYGVVKYLVTSQWNSRRKMRMFHVELNEWQLQESCKLLQTNQKNKLIYVNILKYCN